MYGMSHQDLTKGDIADIPLNIESNANNRNKKN